MPPEQASRRQLLRWLGWFGTANAAVYALILQSYLWSYPFSNELISIVYVLLAFIGHAFLLSFLPLVLLVMPLLLVLPARRPVIALAVTLVSFVVSLVLLDANVFAQNRYHLTWLTFEILEQATLVFAGVFLLIALAFESMLGGIIWRQLATGTPPVRGRWIGMAAAGCLLVSQCIHVWADAVGYSPVAQFTRYMPLYQAMKGKRAMLRLGLVNAEQLEAQRKIHRSQNAAESELAYPLNPMHCRADKTSLPNILIVLIDELRPDTEQLMPELSRFGQKASRFAQHFSGGNSTRMGMFSFFYGLPGTYWQSFYAVQRSPVLMDQIRDNGYQAGLFSAIGFGSPMMANRTAFVSWPGLPSQGAGTSLSEQNRKTTDDWLEWLRNRDTEHPVFGYLHYAPPKAEMSGDDPAQFGDASPLDDRVRSNPEAELAWRRYRRAMQTVDHEFGRVFGALQDESMLDNTIIIVTSDHGSEFDDSGQGYLGHGTAFSRAQLMATMLIAWPGREPVEYQHRTSHYDLPTTLLQDVFACDNPASDYGLGKNLYADESWSWIIAGSYSALAIVQPDRVTVSHPGGFVEVRDQDYQPLSDPGRNTAVISEALEAQSRFLK